MLQKSVITDKSCQFLSIKSNLSWKATILSSQKILIIKIIFNNSVNNVPRRITTIAKAPGIVFLCISQTFVFFCLKYIFTQFMYFSVFWLYLNIIRLFKLNKKNVKAPPQIKFIWSKFYSVFFCENRVSLGGCILIRAKLLLNFTMVFVIRANLLQAMVRKFLITESKSKKSYFELTNHFFLHWLRFAFYVLSQKWWIEETELFSKTL